VTSSIILGRDILKKFGLGLRKIENQAIDDVLNIEINDSLDVTSDSLTFRRPAFKILKYNDFGDYFPVKVF